MKFTCLFGQASKSWLNIFGFITSARICQQAGTTAFRWMRCPVPCRTVVGTCSVTSLCCQGTKRVLELGHAPELLGKAVAKRAGVGKVPSKGLFSEE